MYVQRDGEIVDEAKIVDESIPRDTESLCSPQTSDVEQICDPIKVHVNKLKETITSKLSSKSKGLMPYNEDQFYAGKFHW